MVGDRITINTLTKLPVRLKFSGPGEPCLRVVDFQYLLKSPDSYAIFSNPQELNIHQIREWAGSFSRVRDNASYTDRSVNRRMVLVFHDKPTSYTR